MKATSSSRAISLLQRAGGSRWAKKTLSIAVLATTASCGMLIGIEDLNQGGGADASGGAAGADASPDRAGASGGGAAGGGTGGASGSAGAGIDATGDAPSDTSIPPDGRSDARDAVDGTVADTGDDRSTTDTPLPDGVTADASADAGDANDAGDGADGNVPADSALPDVELPDGALTDVRFDSETVDVVDAAIPDAGSDRPPTVTVTGRIIDYWRHPVPNVPVTIGTAVTTTDMNGQFTVGAITPPYDVFFTISTIVNNTPAKYGWIYKGLTRADPTLQVGRGFPERSANNFDINVSNIDFTNLPATETVHTSFGSVDGAFDTDITGTPTPYIQSSWFGPTTTTLNGHALHWVRASSNTLDLPTAYLGYDAASAPLVDSSTGSISFNLANSTIVSGTLTGTVTASATGGQRENDVYVRFSDNAVMQLAADSSQPTTFSYLVPTLAQGSSITVAASQGSWYSPPYSIVHKDGLAAGQMNVALQIPDAPSLVAPGTNATGVNQSTLFRWSGTAKVFLWAISFSNEYKGFFVVTTEKQGQIPTMPDGPALATNAPFSWWVETNGSYQTVDEATGTDGTLDSFRNGVLWGAVRGDGSYTSSEENTFTSAP